ncbi:MAG: histidine phosphatase family protein [Gammaproteobacteria bacterium]|nr:histidine phosphatase family protein [Gammaproteobacteria bacterium]
MRRLTLIRHAKAVPAGPGQPDFDRPLAQRGQRDARRMAEHLLDRFERPLWLVSSPAPRALATARHYAEALDMPDSGITHEPRIYEAGAGDLLALVNALSDRQGHVLLFGHNPGFSELGALLAAEPFADLPTGAVATLVFDVWRWAAVTPGSGRLLRWLAPRQLAD